MSIHYFYRMYGLDWFSTNFSITAVVQCVHIEDVMKQPWVNSALISSATKRILDNGAM